MSCGILVTCSLVVFLFLFPFPPFADDGKNNLPVAVASAGGQDQVIRC